MQHLLAADLGADEMRKLAMRVGALSIVVAAAAAGTASGQSIRDDIQNALKRKYDILQQQADTERMRAESERTRIETETSQSKGQSYSGGGNFPTSSATYALPVDRDSLGRANPPTYRLGNGVILQMTGIFWPDALTVCVANCQ